MQALFWFQATEPIWEAEVQPGLVVSTTNCESTKHLGFALHKSQGCKSKSKPPIRGYLNLLWMDEILHHPNKKPGMVPFPIPTPTNNGFNHGFQVLRNGNGFRPVAWLHHFLGPPDFRGQNKGFPPIGGFPFTPHKN